MLNRQIVSKQQFPLLLIKTKAANTLRCSRSSPFLNPSLNIIAASESVKKPYNGSKGLRNSVSVSINR